MSQKRRDSKGRILRNGQSQRKDGRYAFKYVDPSGSIKFIYSWRLESNDRQIPGIKPDISLREKENQVQRITRSGIGYSSASTTVSDLVEKYISTKIGVRNSTKEGYRTTLRFLQTDIFGKELIGAVKVSDAKLWLIRLQKDGKGYSTIHTIRGIVRPAFQMAVQDDILERNPFEFELASVVVNDSKTRDAVTRKQEKLFLDFIRTDNHYSRYYEGIYILFNTGLRISEFCGLTVDDIDFKQNSIHVRNQLVRRSDMVLHIEPPKTDAGIRNVPMSNEVAECFKRLAAKQKDISVQPSVDEKSGFFYLDKNGNPMVALHWEHYFQLAVKKYNKIYKIPMPDITPHVCRHTFCSNMAKSGMNPKALQYIMGHSDISVTLNTYTHIGFQDAKEQFRRIGEQ